MTGDEILRRHDREMRARPETGPGFRLSWDGPVLRMTGPDSRAHGNAVLAADLDEAGADAAIARQIAFFAADGRAFEWKHFSHDRPADLPRRLLAAGFRPDPPETFVAFDLEEPFRAPPPPPEIQIGRVDDPAGFGVIAAVNGAVYGDPDHARWLAEVTAAEKRAAPDRLSLHAAWADGVPVSVGWMRHRRGDAFASLWGGSTLPAWRGRGLYAALVVARADEARARGCGVLTVDCSPMSLPILERRGFRRLAAITPFIWRPPGADG